jgi:hypothetical protein
MFTYSTRTGLGDSKNLELKIYELTCSLTIKDKFSNEWRDYSEGTELIEVNGGLFMKELKDLPYTHIELPPNFLENNIGNIFKKIK